MQQLDGDLAISDAFRTSLLTAIKSFGPIKVSELAEIMGVPYKSLIMPLADLKHNAKEIGYERIPERGTYIFPQPIVVTYSN